MAGRKKKFKWRLYNEQRLAIQSVGYTYKNWMPKRNMCKLQIITVFGFWLLRLEKSLNQRVVAACFAHNVAQSVVRHFFYKLCLSKSYCGFCWIRDSINAINWTINKKLPEIISFIEIARSGDEHHKFLVIFVVTMRRSNASNNMLNDDRKWHRRRLLALQTKGQH